MTWRQAWNAFLAYFGHGPKRKPRRARCSCAHPWDQHSARGCSGNTRPEGAAYVEQCLCKLNREGKAARRALAAVKESA